MEFKKWLKNIIEKQQQASYVNNDDIIDEIKECVEVFYVDKLFLKISIDQCLLLSIGQKNHLKARLKL